MPSYRTGAAMSALLKIQAHAALTAISTMSRAERERRMVGHRLENEQGVVGIRYEMPRMSAKSRHGVATSMGRRSRVRVRRSPSSKPQPQKRAA